MMKNGNSRMEDALRDQLGLFIAAKEEISYV